MPGNDLFLQTIEAVYASGLDSERLPQALELTSRMLGAAGATLEIFDKSVQRHSAFHALLRISVSSWSALLPRWLLEHTSEKAAAVSVQRTRKQGHVDKREIALMQRLCPHYQRAYDVATRLRTAGDRGGVLENALEWLADGVALLHADGDIVYANDTFRVLAQRGDAFRTTGRTIEFATHGARRLFEAALGAVKKIGDPSDDGLPTDFLVPRRDGMPAYIVSVRPLLRGKARETQTQADVMLLMRDPLWRNAATSQMLQRLFNLTNAEAHLAHALCTGVTTTTYALDRNVSLNTVYSHLKHIREKTGCKSVPELIRKFGELNVPLRAG